MLSSKNYFHRIAKYSIMLLYKFYNFLSKLHVIENKCLLSGIFIAHIFPAISIVLLLFFFCQEFVFAMEHILFL